MIAERWSGYRAAAASISSRMSIAYLSTSAITGSRLPSTAIMSAR